ncbi:unnamed protein product [Musa hybrid cultivar]
MRRMQRRENNVQSFEKLRRVRHNLDQAKKVLRSLIKREEKKREIVECKVKIQRIQIKYKHEAYLIEDGFPSFQQLSSKFTSSEEVYVDSDDTINGHQDVISATVHPKFADFKLVAVPTVQMKRELKQRTLSNGRTRKRDLYEPVMLFTESLDPDKLAVAGIVPPVLPAESSVAPPYQFHGRIGRGGRIIFDRWNPLFEAPIGQETSLYLPPNPVPPSRIG